MQRVRQAAGDVSVSAQCSCETAPVTPQTLLESPRPETLSISTGQGEGELLCHQGLGCRATTNRMAAGQQTPQSIWRM